MHNSERSIVVCVLRFDSDFSFWGYSFGNEFVKKNYWRKCQKDEMEINRSGDRGVGMVLCFPWSTE